MSHLIRRGKDPEYAVAYAAAEQWRDQSLRDGLSLFDPGRPIWTEEATADLHRRFIEGADEGTDSFDEKLEAQMDGASQESLLLMAELLFIHLLPLTNITQATKTEKINMVGAWAPAPFEVPDSFQPALATGIFSGGAGFNTGRPNHLRFLIRMAEKRLGLEPDQRRLTLSEAWVFKDFLYELPTDGAFSQRNALLLMLFPDQFEDISSRNHKQKIVKAFPDLFGDTSDIDRQLLAIRDAKTDAFGKDFSWYHADIRPLWDKARPKGPSVPQSPAEALLALLPESDDYEAFSKAVANAVIEADAANPMSWSLSWRDHRLFLNVGPNRMMSLTPQGIQIGVAVDDPVAFVDELAHSGVSADLRSEPFVFPGNTYLATAAVEETAAFIAATTEQQRLAIQSTAERDGSFWQSHSDDFLELIRDLSGLEVPDQPDRGAKPVQTQKAWIIRGRRDDGEVDSQGSLERGDTRIFWSVDVPPGSSRDLIKAVLRQQQPDASVHSIANQGGSIHRFITRVQPDDLVAMPDGNDLYFGTVAGAAEYDASAGEWSRPVAWVGESVGRDEVSPALYSRLRSLLTITDISPVLAEVQAYVGGEGTSLDSVMMPEVVFAPIDDDLASDWLLDREWLEEIVGLLHRKRQLIFYGPPGTGKTYLAEQLARHLTSDGGSYSLVQFHPSYSYEDFVEGFRPQVDGDGNLTYVLTPGPLKRLAEAALENPGDPYILLVDEINRGNLAKIFGELYYLLEYRERSLILQYGSGDEDEFSLPENLFVIGTMNTADRSIAMVDAAIRRRFNFVEFSPTTGPISRLLRAWLAKTPHGEEPAALLDELNRRLDDSDYAIGPSYLMNEDVGSQAGLERIWRYSIMPLLVEHFYGRPEVAKQLSLAALQEATSPPDPVHVELDEDNGNDPE